MLRSLLVCGLLAGLCAGLLATGFATVAGEPAIDRAIGFESARAAASGEPPEHAPVSRATQRTFGLATAAIVYGLALGGLFAIAFAAVYGRVSRASPARTSIGLAAAAFVVVFLVPFVKYPANPPGVGDPDTIGRRTALYVALLAISVIAAVGAARLRVELATRRPPGQATLLACATYLALVVVAGLALPTVDEVPRDFPATTLYRFRGASVGMQAVLWATIGLVFAATADRVLRGLPLLELPRRSRHRAPGPGGR